MEASIGEEERERMLAMWSMAGWKWKQVPRTSKETDFDILGAEWRSLVALDVEL